MKRQLFAIALILVAFCRADEAARSEAETQSPEALRAAAQQSPIPWKTPTYTLVARDMDLRTALDTFAVAEGLSVVMSEGVQGVFSGDFKELPCGEFLERIATIHNLTWYYEGAAPCTFCKISAAYITLQDAASESSSSHEK